MTVHELVLDSDSGEVEVEVIVGQGQVGFYHVYLWDENRNSEKLSHGNNFDDWVDRFSVGLPQGLVGRTLSWEVLIEAPGSGSGQLYSLTILFRQDGSVVPGGVIQETGQMNDTTKAIVGYVRFLV